MQLEMLVTSMKQTDTSKYQNMNLQTDTIIANQADVCSYIEEKRDDCTVKMITTNTKGLSVNRNIALMYSTADYIMFADDDMIFVDDYVKIVEDELEKCQNADAIKFYCESLNRPLSFGRPKKLQKVGKRKIMSAGVVGLMVRREFLINNCLYFQKNLGSGAEVICGEDSVFYNDFLKRKGKIYISPKLISYIDQSHSTWNQGIDEKHLKSIGYIYSKIYGKMAILAIVRRAWKSRNKTEKFTTLQMIKTMIAGARTRKDR